MDLLSTLSPEEEAALGLAMRVALPLLRATDRFMPPNGTTHPLAS